MKKAFTLLEVTISITLFMILIFFLYKTLDQTKHTNELFESKKDLLKKYNRLNNIFLEDFAELFNNIKPIKNDKNQNSIVKFESKNIFHNSFYNNITYLINDKKELIRMESKSSFEEERNASEFYNDVYIDVLLKNIEFFKAKYISSEKSVIFIIKQKNSQIKIYKAFIFNSP